MSIPLAQANRIVAAALAAARAAGHRPMAVVVVDAAGHIRSAQREDGATPFRLDIALGKAWASAAMGASSRVLAQRAQDMPGFFGALATAGQGKFIPQTGAVLIQAPDGSVIGAVGASGGSGDEDEQICIAGLAAEGLGAG